VDDAGKLATRTSGRIGITMRKRVEKEFEKVEGPVSGLTRWGRSRKKTAKGDPELHME